MKKWMILGFFLAVFHICSLKVMAAGQVLGIHILKPYELDNASKLIKIDETKDEWQYVTIPLSLDDLDNKDEWQQFFDRAKDKKIIPLVRLVSRFEGTSWQVPNRKEIVDLITFLDELEWPTDKRHIIVFNEPNHAKEWGGTIDPQSYVEILRFASLWAHAEDSRFRVLPAGLDLAASNTGKTAEAFWYLEQMAVIDPDIFSYVDYWNSHSYPNPGFSSSPERTAQNSLRGFQYELAYLKKKTDKDFKVFITETGWEVNSRTNQWLEAYYTYAIQHIWSDPQIVAVTPFLLQGDPGPFQGFTFLDRNGHPTVQYSAFQEAMKLASKQ